MLDFKKLALLIFFSQNVETELFNESFDWQLNHLV